jgi:hypothetical protein
MNDVPVLAMRWLGQETLPAVFTVVPKHPHCNVDWFACGNARFPFLLCDLYVVGAPGVTLDVASEFLLFEELRGAG